MYVFRTIPPSPQCCIDLHWTTSVLASIKCITPSAFCAEHSSSSVLSPPKPCSYSLAPSLSRFSRRSHPLHPPLDFSLSLFSSLFPGLRRPSFKAHGVFCFPSAGVTIMSLSDKSLPRNKKRRYSQIKESVWMD